MQKFYSTDDGIQILGSILWLDAKAKAGISFFSSAASIDQKPTGQIITTEETSKVLETLKRRPNALVCQYNRPFSIGRLKMELLPSGTMIGGASIYIENEKERILYAPHVQIQKIHTNRHIQLKKASTLLLGAYHPDPNLPPPNRKKEKERLLEFVSSEIKKGSWPTILCDPFTIAQEITHLFSENDISVSVHPVISRIHKIYETYGIKLGNFNTYSPRAKRQKVVILPKPRRLKSMPSNLISNHPLIVIESFVPSLNEEEIYKDIAHNFKLNMASDGKELKEVIQSVDPKELCIFGPFAKKYAEEFKSICPKVEPLYLNNQPTLL